MKSFKVVEEASFIFNKEKRQKKKQIFQRINCRNVLKEVNVLAYKLLKNILCRNLHHFCRFQVSHLKLQFV